MKLFAHLLTIATVTLVTGCVSQHPKPATPHAATQFSGTLAHITKLDDRFHFVVIDFNSRTMPAAGTRVSIYRGDQRVSVVQITEPIRSHFATADILEGDPRVGDEVR
jgi:hypothetical protein